MERVRALLGEEAGRFARALAPVSPPEGQLDELAAAVAGIERAR
jgi:hypothetical protein